MTIFGLDILPAVTLGGAFARSGGQNPEVYQHLNVPGVEPGMLVVLFGFYSNSANVPALSAPSGWTQRHAGSFSSTRINIWTKVLTEADTATGIVVQGSTFNISSGVAMFKGAKWGAAASAAAGTTANASVNSPSVAAGQKLLWAVSLRLDSGTINCDRGVQVADTGSGLRLPSKLFMQDNPPLGVTLGTTSHSGSQEKTITAVRLDNL